LKAVVTGIKNCSGGRRWAKSLVDAGRELQNSLPALTLLMKELENFLNK
jgi:hypothetical protein